ncbi:hypothetical protein CDEST_09572 [Colletotrichum destructivum]|uniref:Uncharacterized protein n=1 Tax=Colletotrichum destructivum TaxID=34406 RepID=A0AAX4IM08_9PEZI|nr:hypothetical protein CDEST_09572 [Colletotrichum destructivum]
MEYTYSSLLSQLAQPYDSRRLAAACPASFRATVRVDSRLGDKRIERWGTSDGPEILGTPTEARTETVAIQSTYEFPREIFMTWHPSFDREWAVRLLHEEETRVGGKMAAGMCQGHHDTSPVMVDIAPGLIIPITPDVLSPITNRQEFADDATLPPAPPADRTMPDASPHTAAQSHVALQCRYPE